MRTVAALLINLTLFLTSLLVTALGAEVLYRLMMEKESFLHPPVPLPENWSLQLPSNQLAIVGVGESTMLGEPYEQRLNMMKIVRLYLSEAYPQTPFAEYVLAHPSATLRSVYYQLLEVLRQKPAVVVFYFGNNDFLAEFGNSQICRSESSQLYRALHRSQLFQFLWRRYLRQDIGALPQISQRDLFDRPVVCEEQWDDVLENYRQYIFDLAERCNRASIPAILVFPAGNEAGFSPNRSVYTGKEENRAAFAELYARGRRLLLEGRASEARDAFDKAKVFDPTFADLSYRLGQVHQQLGEPTAAQADFTAAREHDGFPWRALQAQRGILIDAAHRFGAHFLDAREILLATHSPLDNRLFHDMHHPTLEGYHLIARTIVDEIVRGDLLQLGAPRSFRTRSESELLLHFSFSSGSWRDLLLSRVAWMDKVRGMSFDPLERLELLRAYIDALNLIDENALRLPENERLANQNIAAEIQAARERWGQVQTQEGRLNLTSLWPYFTSTDIAPVHAPPLASAFSWSLLPTRDGEGCDGLPLTVGGVPYKAGFLLHPTPQREAEAVFRPDGKYRIFRAEVGVADTGSELSSLRCAVLGDLRVLLDLPIKRWHESPTPIKVPIEGIKELRVRCGDAGDGDRFDHAAWLNPRFE